jgi:hypothetical protein
MFRRWSPKWKGGERVCYMYQIRNGDVSVLVGSWNKSAGLSECLLIFPDVLRDCGTFRGRHVGSGHFDSH